MSSEVPWSAWIFDGSVLLPASEWDLNQVRGKFGVGTGLRAKFSKPRSLPQHRLYWSVLSEVVDATGMWATPEDLHEAIKLQLRMVRGISMLNGEMRFITRSISFEAMPQQDFVAFFDKAMLAITEATGIDTNDLIKLAKLKCGYREMEQEDDRSVPAKRVERQVLAAE